MALAGAVLMRAGGMELDPTTEFFQELEARGHEPGLEKVTGTLRFDLRNGKRTARWLVAIEKGYAGRRPRTWVRITPEGRTALAEELRLLRQLLDGPPLAAPAEDRPTAPARPDRGG